MPTAPSPTRVRLLDSALQRFANDGPLATTLGDVRADAGTSVGAVYHHFPDKEALYDAVRERALAIFRKRSRPSSRRTPMPSPECGPSSPSRSAGAPTTPQPRSSF